MPLHLHHGVRLVSMFGWEVTSGVSAGRFLSLDRGPAAARINHLERGGEDGERRCAGLLADRCYGLKIESGCSSDGPLCPGCAGAEGPA